MFDSRIFNAGANATQRRKSVQLLPKRGPGGTTAEGLADHQFTYYSNVGFELVEAAKKAAEKKPEKVWTTSECGHRTLSESRIESLVGKMMQIADMPVGTKYKATYGADWVKVSAKISRDILGYQTDPKYWELAHVSIGEVLADPVIECGDIIQCTITKVAGSVVRFHSYYSENDCVSIGDSRWFRVDKVVIIEKGAKK